MQNTLRKIALASPLNEFHLHRFASTIFPHPTYKNEDEEKKNNVMLCECLAAVRYSVSQHIEQIKVIFLFLMARLHTARQVKEICNRSKELSAAIFVTLFIQEVTFNFCI